MAKKKNDNYWRGAAGEQARDSAFMEMRKEAHQRLGCADISVGKESEYGHVGLPLPALCLRYFFRATTFPLSRIVQITGEEGSGKSILAAEILRWHLGFGGNGWIIENENKDIADLRHALLQWHEPWMNRVMRKKTYSLEECQDVLTVSTAITREHQDAKDGPGHTIPTCWIIDSIMGTAPKEQIAQVEKDGHAIRSYALAANLISSYMRSMPDRIQAYPFTIVGTNHLKPAMTPMGLPTSNIPGGKSVKFYETFEIEVSKQMNCDISTQEVEGLRVELKCKKNGIGPARMRIRCELLWWYVQDPTTGELKQLSAWDWDTASIELILHFEEMKGKRKIYNDLQDICDINVVGKKGDRQGWSAALGVPEEEPVHFRILGQKLEGRPDLLERMYKVLWIVNRRVFQPGADYRDLLAEAKAEAGKLEAAARAQGITIEAAEAAEDEAAPAFEGMSPEPVAVEPTPAVAKRPRKKAADAE